MICDASDQTGLFWLTGSESKKLLKEARDSLAGRICILKMYSLSRREKAGKSDLGEIGFSLYDVNLPESIPVTFISGSLDYVCPVQTIENYIDKSGVKGSLNMIDGCGHNVQYTMPKDMQPDSSINLSLEMEEYYEIIEVRYYRSAKK